MDNVMDNILHSAADPEKLTNEKLLEFLDTAAKGIAMMFGESCETVVQEIIGAEGDENGEHAGDVHTLQIYNGHVTGRSAGTYRGVFGVYVDVPREKLYEGNGLFNQLVILPDGRRLKSSSWFVESEGHRYILGVNYDCTFMGQLQGALDAFLQYEGNLYDRLAANAKGEDVVQTTFEACMMAMQIPVEKMKKADRVRLIRMLYERGFFQLQKSVPYAAEKLGITKYSVYKYLKEVNGDTEDLL